MHLPARVFPTSHPKFARARTREALFQNDPEKMRIQACFAVIERVLERGDGKNEGRFAALFLSANYFRIYFVNRFGLDEVSMCRANWSRLRKKRKISARETHP